MFMLISIIFLLLLSNDVQCFQNKLNFSYKNPIKVKPLTVNNLLPQIVFAASCAGAVFSYVYFNIDSIKEVLDY
jgi:hypothetical protein